MKRHILASVLLALAPFAAAAQQVTGEKIVVAKCGDAGCQCTLSDFDLETLSFLTGQDLPADAVKGTFVTYKGQSYLSQLSPDEVHQIAGGEGRCEMALFDPVVPRDGLWQGTVRVQSMSGCHPQVAEMVPAIAAGMENTVQIVWDGRFHPQKLAANGTDNVVVWNARGPSSFTGHIEVPQSDVLRVETALTASLTAPDKATATLRLRIAASGGNKAVMQAARMADCRTFAVYDFWRVSD
ncbi:hypothetical protein MASR2M74_03870 [Paracoccaceae bacterium]